MYIAHRINYLDATISHSIFSIADGIEFDIRDSSNELFVTHDPFTTGQKFCDFLQFCPIDKFYIVNIKSEGIEYDVLKLLNNFNIQKFFLLDCSFPMIHKLAKEGEKRIAIRFSEYESIETLILNSGKIDWVWIDTFTKCPLNKDNYTLLKKYGYNLCFVSPELQNQPDKLIDYKHYLQSNNIVLDAICTKIHNITLWSPSEISPCPK